VFDLPAVRLAYIKEASELGICRTPRGDRFVSKANETFPKSLLASQTSTEGIGLVREFCGEDSKCQQSAQ
jgi:hypothetical protein